jgi:hypothetical protein
VTGERREFVGRWSGRIAAGAEDEHAHFVDSLRTPEGAQLLQRCNLTEYVIYQQGPDLEVVFKSERPSIIAGFLRNRRLWPHFWEFIRTGDEEAVAGRDALFHWTRT